MGMGGQSPAGSKAAPLKTTIIPKVVFPAEGQYLVFVNFWPRVGGGVSSEHTTHRRIGKDTLSGFDAGRLAFPGRWRSANYLEIWRAFESQPV